MKNTTTKNIGQMNAFKVAIYSDELDTLGMSEEMTQKQAATFVRELLKIKNPERSRFKNGAVKDIVNYVKQMSNKNSYLLKSLHS